jgi:hypothetical protein
MQVRSIAAYRCKHALFNRNARNEGITFVWFVQIYVPMHTCPAACRLPLLLCPFTLSVLDRCSPQRLPMCCAAPSPPRPPQV